MVTILSQESIDAFRKSLSVKGRSGHTIRAYVADVNGLATWYQNSGRTYKTFEEVAAAFLNQTRQSQAPKTVNRKLATFRTYAKFHGDHTALDDYSKPRIAEQHPHPLNEGADGVDRMLEKCKSDEERAIVVLCGMVALRISEARNVLPSHVDLSTGSPILKVRGKGDKTREIPVGTKAWATLQPIYLRLVLTNTKFILLSDSAARRTWTRLGARAELGRRTSSHDGRATKATHLLNSGANVRVVQTILGHASLNTTQIYLGTSMRDMTKAMEL